LIAILLHKHAEKDVRINSSWHRSAGPLLQARLLGCPGQ
jgi:hypothetical protein